LRRLIIVFVKQLVSPLAIFCQVEGTDKNMKRKVYASKMAWTDENRLEMSEFKRPKIIHCRYLSPLPDTPREREAFLCGQIVLCHLYFIHRV